MEKNQGQTSETIISVTVREPLLGFQQGYALLDAIRPMNQGNKIYPLAIQDYQLTFKRFVKKDRVKRVLRDVRFKTDYEGYGDVRGEVVLYPTNVIADAVLAASRESPSQQPRQLQLRQGPHGPS